MENYDKLTNNLSMDYFLMMAESGRKRFIREGYDMAILFVNLCNMKEFNYRYGMAEGDELLKTMGDIIARHFGKDNCGRLRGDHFVVFTVSEGLEDKLGELFMILKDINGGKTVPVKVGVYLNSIEEVSISIAVDRAKMACEHIRGSKESHYKFFSEKLLEQSQRRRYIIENIDKAIERGWMSVFHQPVVRSSTGRVSAEEALARWNDPKYGNIDPDEFVPILEEARLTYKLDLFVVDQIIKKIKMQSDAGLVLVVESVNLSRSDFDCCDMVEEIRKRMDGAGLDHKLLAIEIAEVMLCNDFYYMKIQVERFREMGFKVWLDKFGSGYVSPEMNRKIKFDLFKLDRTYLAKLTSDKKGRVVLAELVGFAAALGVDTAAVGVEDKDQAEFLCEVGVVKHQGYHYCRPVTMTQLFDRYENGAEMSFENPLEAGYYDAISRVNLYGMSITSEDETKFDSYFSSMPMVLLEVNKEGIKVIRGNRVHREFISGHFPILADDKKTHAFKEFIKGPGSLFMNAAKRCASDGKRVVVEERTPTGDTIHVLINRIAKNPVTKAVAIMAAILVFEEKNEWDMGLNYTYMARALSSDYVSLFFVDMDNDTFTEYSPDDGNGELAVKRHGNDFFKQVAKDVKTFIFKDDQKTVISAFTKRNIEKNIKEHGVFSLTYRLVRNGEVLYANLKAVKMRAKGNCLIIGVSDVDAQMKEREIYEKAKEERLIYSRMNALSGDYICFYTVDPETDHFYGYKVSSQYEKFEVSKEGEDFFGRVERECHKYITLADMDSFMTIFKKENILSTIEEDGIFVINYRVLFQAAPIYVCLKAVITEEDGKKQLIIGMINIDAQVKRDQEYARNLSAARDAANIDALTGVRNKHAYVDVEAHINSMIEDGIPQKFAVVVFDINDLKQINDTKGHKAGDDYIKEGCAIICDIFANSTVFRIGGDEFAVIAMESDYEKIDQLMEKIEKSNRKNMKKGEVVIACGMSRFDNDRKVTAVFERADNLMYEDKKKLKQMTEKGQKDTKKK